jgi:hypothetical protein
MATFDFNGEGENGQGIQSAILLLAVTSTYPLGLLIIAYKCTNSIHEMK